MKTLILVLTMFVVAFIPFNENNYYDASVEKEIVTMDLIENAISIDLPEIPCIDSDLNNSELCSCVAAGNCKWSPTSSGCYIIFCDGHIEQDPTSAKADNVTTITVPCESG